MKPYFGWILLGVAIAVILYLLFRPLPSFDNKQALKTIDSLKKENDLYRSSLSAQFNNFRVYKDSSIKVIDSLKNRNQVLRSNLSTEQINERDLANQIINALPEQKIDSPCIELAKKVLSDSITIVDYQKNTDRLIFTFEDGMNKMDSIIQTQQKVILSDSVVMANQKALTDLQQKQLKSALRQGKTAAWIGRSLAVVALVLGGILLSK